MTLAVGAIAEGHSPALARHPRMACRLNPLRCETHRRIGVAIAVTPSTMEEPVTDEAPNAQPSAPQIAFPRDIGHAPYCVIDELRFFADFGNIRVVCRISRSFFADVFHPAESSPRARLKAFEDNRATIERAAERKILAGDFDTKIWHSDSATWSIVLTETDLRGP